MPAALVENTDRPTCLNLNSACPIPPGGITSKPLLDVAGTRMILFAMDAGQEISPHRASYPATVHVLTGRLDFTLQTQSHDLHSGDFLFMPKDAEHSLRALEPTTFLLTLAKGQGKD